ncbi:type VI secretion system protein TssL, short form [Serratia sp. D1N4]
MKTPPVDIDALLQDSYLLVVQLRQGAAVEQGAALWQHCTAQIEQTRQRLREQGVNERSVDHLCYALCALLDETVLVRAKGAEHAAWAAQPLQAHFFNQHQAGVQLYDTLRAVLREPAPDVAVLTGFHRVLMLGFCGHYGEEHAPERVKLLTELASRVTPLAVTPGMSLLIKANRRQWAGWMSSRVVHLLVAVGVLASLWWGLQQHLATAITALLPGHP